MSTGVSAKIFGKRVPANLFLRLSANLFRKSFRIFLACRLTCSFLNLRGAWFPPPRLALYPLSFPKPRVKGPLARSLHSFFPLAGNVVLKTGQTGQLDGLAGFSNNKPSTEAASLNATHPSLQNGMIYVVWASTDFVVLKTGQTGQRGNPMLLVFHRVPNGGKSSETLAIRVYGANSKEIETALATLGWVISLRLNVQ